jgi:hypothetical protein
MYVALKLKNAIKIIQIKAKTIPALKNKKGIIKGPMSSIRLREEKRE